MSRRIMKSREGFSLAELIIALTLTAIIGGAMTTLFVSQAKLIEQQQKQSLARGVTRSTSNIVMSELRMIEKDSGIVAASDSSITVRVPYAMAISCGNPLAVLLSILVLPADSMMYDSAHIAGFAYRKTDGTYHYTATTTDPAAVPSSTVCATAGVSPTAVAGSTKRTFVTTVAPPVGAPILLYQIVRYHFGTSALVPGRKALYRNVPVAGGTGVDEELVAPFDNTARFNYFVSDAKTAQSSAPSARNTITGVEIVMNSISERPDKDGTYTIVPLKTAVFFKNRRN